MRLKFGLAVAMFCLFTGLSQNAMADAIYSLTSTNPIVPPFSWSLSTPTLLTSTQDFTSFLSTNPPSGPGFTCPIHDVSIDPGTGFVTTNFSANCQNVTFSFGALDHFGSYGNPDVVLTVSSPVPEPDSLLLLGTGLLGSFGAVRRKLAK